MERALGSREVWIGRRGLYRLFIYGEEDKNKSEGCSREDGDSCF